MRTAVMVALALLAQPAWAADVVYTGCLKSSDGSLYYVREGTTPMAPCAKKDKPISWNMAGPQGPQGPPGTSIPRNLSVTVNCPGESINAALARQADRLDILIKGTCEERVGIIRDDVTLRGEEVTGPASSPASKIKAPDDGGVITIDGGRVLLQDLFLEGGRITLGLGASADVQLTRTVVSGGDIGIYAENSAVSCFHCTIRDNNLAMNLDHSSFYSAFADIENNPLGIGLGASVLVLDSATVHGSMWASFGTLVAVVGTSMIDGGTGPGISLGDSCTATVADTSSVSGSPGVLCAPSPSLAHLTYPWPSSVTTQNCPASNSNP